MATLLADCNGTTQQQVACHLTLCADLAPMLEFPPEVALAFRVAQPVDQDPYL